MPKTSSVDVLSQDIIHLERVVNDLSNQLNKMQKQAFFDTADADNYMKESFGELLNVVSANTQATSQLIGKHKKSEAEEAQEFYRVRKRIDSSSKTEYTKRLVYLTTLKQKVSGVCQCGKHKAIHFMDGAETVETMCPVNWWVAQSYMAFVEKRLAQFNQSTPMTKYVQPYLIK